MSCKTYLSAAAAALAVGTQSFHAAACGGLFCSAANPVEQSAERIVFSVNDNNTVTAIIEVQYEGPSERFAWLLPMPGTPDVAVSTVEVLDAIDSATAPRYQLQYDYGDCTLYPRALADGNIQATAGPGALQEEDNGIQVLASGSAGPYDYVTIKAPPGLEDPAQEAVDWLTANDYDVSLTGPGVLRPYLEAGLNLVAFKLTKGNDAGAIRPVQLTYVGTTASIPIRPTAVAAQEDMGIRVFVLGGVRSVSGNYLSLELNEKRIDWFNWQNGYDALVSEAADEAGGHGFVTEFAGLTTSLKGQLWTDYTEAAWVSLQDDVDASGAQTMLSAANSFRRYEGFRRATEAAVMLPEGLSIDDFGRDPVGYEQQYGEQIADRAKFLDALEAEIVTPLRDAQALVDAKPYLSRLYTTLSPVEMDEDPLFVFNADLPEVSNVHTAQVAYSCSADGSDMTYELIFKDGSTLKPTADGNPSPVLSALPAARSIAMVTSSGAGQVLSDNSRMIDDALVAEDVGTPATEAPTGRPATASESDADGAGCSVALVSAPAQSARWLWLLALPVLRRRRQPGVAL